MILKKIKTYFSLPNEEKRIVRQLFFWLIITLFLVRIVPLRYFHKFIGKHHIESNQSLNQIEINTLNSLKHYMKKIKKILPWKVKCFEESLSAKKILAKHKIASTLYLGVHKTNDNLKAHAWLSIDNEVHFGKSGYKQFTVVSFFG